MLSRDGVVFIDYAQSLQNAPLETLRAQAHHPLYPLSILAAKSTLFAGVSDPVRQWELAGVVAAMMAGLLLVLAEYALARALFNRQAGLWAALLTACCAEFCQLSADALSDMLHLALYGTAATLGLRLIQTWHWGWAIGAGAVSSLAFLTRPEGGEVALLLLPAVLIAPGKWSKKCASLGLVVAGFVVAASPYMIITGKVVQKKSLEQFIFGMEAEPPVEHSASIDFSAQALPLASMSGIAPMAAVLLENYFRSFRIMLFLPVLFWWIRYRRCPVGKRDVAWILALMGAHVLILFALITRFEYLDDVSLRHVFILTGLTLPFAAAGIVALLQPYTRRLVKGSLLAAFLVIPTLPWMFEARHTEDLYLRRAGEWIRQEAGDDQRIMTTRMRIAYYAAGELLPSSPGVSVPWIYRLANEHDAQWLVFDTHRKLEQDPDFFITLEAETPEGSALERVHEEHSTRAGRSARIYRYGPAP